MPLRSPSLLSRLEVPSLLWGVLTACAGDGSAPAVPAEIRATSGGDQTGTAGTVLPQPVVATVLDAEGSPLAGVQVSWSAGQGGRIAPAEQATDQKGQARAQWLLGEESGVVEAFAAVGELPPARFQARAEPASELPFDQVRLLTLPTYEGSGQVVHPDYASSPNGVLAYKHFLAITPYPYGNASFENPSLFAGSSPPRDWLLPPGASNPVAWPASGHLSDPDLVYVDEPGELWLYYRQASADNVVWLVRSPDGVAWSDPVEVARAPSHDLVSPAIVRRGPGDWWMWSVRAGPVGCGASSTTVELRRSDDGISWSAPEPVDLAQPRLWTWHIDVQWVPSSGRFWAVYNAKTEGGCATPAVFVATSADGRSWTVVQAPVITKGRIPQFEDIVYRSSLAYDPASDAVTFWYSGARYDGSSYVWSAAVERRRRAQVFGAPLTGVDERLFLPPPAPLTEWP